MTSFVGKTYTYRNVMSRDPRPRKNNINKPWPSWFFLLFYAILPCKKKQNYTNITRIYEISEMWLIFASHLENKIETMVLKEILLTDNVSFDFSLSD